MVLRKRQRSGEFVLWTPPGQVPSTTVGASVAWEQSYDLAPPPRAKKARLRHVQEETYIPPLPPLPASSKSVPNHASASPSEILLKKSRKKADPNATPSEKRGAMFKKKCPQNILQRVERVMSQRFFMIDRERTPGELREEFSVLGSTGNVYTVVIGHRPSCSCPDATKGNHCKHILFIFLKVLQVTQASSHWYQKALLTTELEEIFAEAPLAPNSVAHPRIREAHARATGKTTAATPSTSSTNKNRRIPGPDDDCPICYESMHGVPEKTLAFCEDCGNALHNECFQQWQASTSRDGKSLSCVWCRARWVLPVGLCSGVSGSGVRRSEGYINLADFSGTSPVRDTSTYYHGPRRGHRYLGYQDYD